MKKQILFLMMIIAVMGVVSGCGKRQLINQLVSETVSEKENSFVPEMEYYDITKWETFIDERLKIGVKYPKDKCFINGSQDGLSFSVECNDSFLEFTKTDWSLANRNLKMIAEINNKNNGSKNKVEQKKLGSIDCFQFIVSSDFYDQTLDDKVEDRGRILRGDTLISIFEYNNEVFIIKSSKDNLSRYLLENFYLVE